LQVKKRNWRIFLLTAYCLPANFFWRKPPVQISNRCWFNFFFFLLKIVREKPNTIRRHKLNKAHLYNKWKSKTNIKHFIRYNCNFLDIVRILWILHYHSYNIIKINSGFWELSLCRISYKFHIKKFWWYIIIFHIIFIFWCFQYVPIFHIYLLYYRSLVIYCLFTYYFFDMSTVRTSVTTNRHGRTFNFLYATYDKYRSCQLLKFLKQDIN